MSSVKIVAYKAYWKWYDGEGSIGLKPSNAGFFFLQVKDPQQFSVMVDLLRNEKPIFWDHNTKTLGTSAEPVGEEET